MSRSSLESIAETSCPLPPATFPGKPQLPTTVTAVQESLGLQPQEGKGKNPSKFPRQFEPKSASKPES